MTQEIRQLVMFETKAEIDKVIEVIKNLKIEVKDEWSDGLVTGLDLAINVLKKDKNAISVSQT
jgi:U3 small nucleolar ribonucleoprotein component